MEFGGTVVHNNKIRECIFIILMLKDGRTHHGRRLLHPFNQAVINHVIAQFQASHSRYLFNKYFTVIAFICLSDIIANN